VPTRRNILYCLFGAAVACKPKKGTGFNGYAFVANEESKTIAVVDLMNFQVRRLIPLPENPGQVLASPNRNAIYVLAPRTAAVYEIDTEQFIVRRKIQAGRNALSMRLSAESDALWVLCADPPRVVKIGLEHFRVSFYLSLPAAPADFDLSPDGHMCAVSLASPGSLSLFSPPRRQSASPIRIGNTAGVIRFRSDGRQLLVAIPEERILAIVEVPSCRLVVRLPLAVRPDNFCFKKDGGQLFITGEGMDAVVIVYPYTTEVAKTVLAGRTPGAMTVSGSENREYLFVANTQSGDVTIMSLDTQRVIAVLTVGEEPACIAMTPDDQYALVLNRRSGNMAVIRLAAIVPRRTRSAPLFTVIPVGAKPVSVAIHPV